MAEENMLGPKMLDWVCRREIMRLRVTGVALLFALVALVMMSACAGQSLASGGVVWRVSSEHGPQNMVPGGTGEYAIVLQNIGVASANLGGDLTVTDSLPAGVSVLSDPSDGNWDCSTATFPANSFPTVLGGTVSCKETAGSVPAPTVGVTPAENRGMAPVLYLPVSVDVSASGAADNQVSVSSEAGAATASVADLTTFGTTAAGFGLSQFVADAFDGSGDGASPVRQAGAHPSEVRFDLDFNLTQTTDVMGTYTEPQEQAKTIDVSVPQGFIGNPEATPKCTVDQLSQTTSIFGGSCPPSTQVGTTSVIVNNLTHILAGDNPNVTQNLPVYNMIPPTGTVADFAFTIEGLPIHITASLDPANHYGIKTTLNYVTPLFPVRIAHLSLWGVPADPVHDALRYLPTTPPTFGTPANVPAKPFVTLPSQCDTPTVTQLTMESWQQQGSFTTPVSSTPATATGCEKQLFSTAIYVTPTTTKADSASGLSVEIDVHQSDNPAGLGTPPLKKAVVRLPNGMTISPSSADGLVACTSAQIGLGKDSEPTCPDASKIGTATLDTPLLPGTVHGSAYVAAQNDNPFGSLIALYIVLEDKDRGLLVKLPGKVEMDPATGQLTTTFDDNPQLPFSKLTLQLKSGPRAPLVTPMVCGTATTTAQLTSWNSQIPVSTSQDSFTVSSDGNGTPCPARQTFNPGFKAGTTNAIAGSDASFVTTLTRPDGDQELKGLTLSLPPGLLGRISSTVLCPDTAANAGTCSDASKIATVIVGAGPGSNPFYVTDGRAYITGPYKSAPFGLSIVVHAQAGPFDLGDVVVRAAIDVDPDTAAIKIASDPLPTILQGIPLRVRAVNVTVDRSGFFFNPTNCTPTAITGQILGAAGAIANVHSRFQVGDCAALAFKPRMSITVGSEGHTRAGATTILRTTLRVPRGNANLRAVSVNLPTTLNARLGVVAHACTLAHFQADHCASAARIGSAVAVTPVLRDPLRGSVYFVKNPARPIPDIVIALRGQVNFNLTGKVKIPGGKRLSAYFDTVPDVPVASFTLQLVSGKNGPLGTTVNLCTPRGKTAPATLGFRAQNANLVKVSQRLHIAGCPKK